MVFRLYVFALWVGAGRDVHTRDRHYLVTYLHQLTLPGSYLASPLGSSLHRLVWLALRGRVAWWAVGVHLSHVAHGDCGHVFGTVPGSAVRTRPSDSAIVCVCVWALPCLSWELEGRHGFNLVGGSGFNVVKLLLLPDSMWSVY